MYKLQQSNMSRSKKEAREYEMKFREAAKSGKLEDIKTLVNQVSLESCELRNLMKTAVIQGNLSVVQYLCHKVDLYENDCEMIELAKDNGRLGIFECLREVMNEPRVIERSRRKHAEEMQRQSKKDMEELFSEFKKLFGGKNNMD